MISACGGFQLIRCLNIGDGVDTTQKQKIRMKDKVGFFPTPIRSGKYVVKKLSCIKDSENKAWERTEKYGNRCSSSYRPHYS